MRGPLGRCAARDVFEYPENWPKRERQGEWHFGWVFEDRAIEDVFIVPPRAQRTPDTPREGNRYGASLRGYDAERDEWHITWINPVTLADNRLVGRKQGGEIDQEGMDGGQPSIAAWRSDLRLTAVRSRAHVAT